MLVYSQCRKWYTVKDMYNYCKENNLKLLSSYDEDFWNEYVTNHSQYDKLFKRYYSSFRYFMQDAEQTLQEVTTDFIDEVENHLLINRKKYEELYRVYVLADTSYSFMDNYNVEEKMDRDLSTDGTYTQGSRQDLTTSDDGERTDTSENQVSAFNSEDYNNANLTTDTTGRQLSTEQYDKGQQINDTDETKTEDYTLTKKGKIGEMSSAEMIKKHLGTWDKYKFYQYIFNEISAELLLS